MRGGRGVAVGWNEKITAGAATGRAPEIHSSDSLFPSHHQIRTFCRSRMRLFIR